MKKLYTFLLILTVSVTSFAQVIYIDPGHGYGSSTSVNPDGRTSTEIETNLAVGLKLKTLLNNSCSSVVVRMSRTTNVNGWSNVSARALQAQNWNADRLLSIHCNADGDRTNDAAATSTATGTETFYSTSTKSTANSQSPAVHFAYSKLINAELAAKGQMFKRNAGNPILRENLGVLGRSTTSCLNELGFTDNASDKAKLLSNSWRENFALGFYTALKSNLNIACGTSTIKTPGAFTLTVTAECNGKTSQNRLNWTASANATSYDIYKNGALWDTNVTTTTYTNANGVVAGATNTYYVKAKNSGSATTNNSNGTVSVVAKRCSAPGDFTISVKSECSSNTARNIITWTTSTGATSYALYRNGSLYASDLTGPTYTNTSVTSGTTYSYYVIAKNASAQTTNSNGAKSIVTTACGAPGAFNLNVSAGCDGATSTINLSWSASANATLYDIYRNGSLYASNIVGTSFENTYLITPGTTFSYYVKAKNATSFQTINSNGTVSAAGKNCKLVTPFTLYAKAACDGTTSKIDLTWTASVNATSYDIYRNGNLYAPDVTGTSFSNTYLITAGTTFTYYVKAKNSYGSINNSNGTLSVVGKSCNTARIAATDDNSFIEKTTLSFYPNPTEGELNLKVNKTNIENIDYMIMDINGRIIKKGSMKELEVINISNLPAATYFIRTVIDGEEFVKQIIKK